VIFPPYVPSLRELGQVIVEQGITILWLTAVLLQQMVDERLGDLRNVRQLLAGGDVLSLAHVNKISQALPTCRVINGYGPTESTTFACCYAVHPDSPIGPSLPIGRPIANRKVYVLDRQLQPVPVGVPGELYIGGAGLARGYFNRPELTAELFIPNPFGSEAGARLYKTGDLVRYLPDGNLEFLGRIDEQVKIRGYRIEPGEIEVVLGQHPVVQNSVVLARIDEFGDKILVAYVVPTSGPLRVKELRRFLNEQLPDYMVPSAFMMLDPLPMTPSGKIDRRALPTPDRNRPELEDDFTPSQSPMEQQIAAIWSEVLDIEQIGRHDNFFELGGHSLLATRVVSRITQQLKVHLPLRILFEKPTVVGLAQHLQNIDRSSNSATIIGHDEYVF
jgi:aspartate racemase